MAFSWEKDGTLIETMTEEGYRAGGEWVIGDRLPDGHPGKTDGSLLVKSWVALPDKYSGDRYPWKHRADERMWEQVWVLDGRLDCLVVQGSGERRTVLEYPRRRLPAELPPDAIRRWRLPDGYQEARGIAVCHHKTRRAGFELQTWADDRSVAACGEPFGFSNWHVRYVEVFQGRLRCQPYGGSPPAFDVARGQRVFLAPWSDVEWDGYSDEPSHGVVFYL